MSSRKTPIERVVRVNGKIVGVVLLVGLCAVAQAVATAQLASGPVFEFEIIPPHPTPSDDITLKLSGVWGCSNVPMDPQVEVVGFEIHIATSTSDVACNPLETRWMLMVPIGQLPAGMYHVTVTFSGFGLPPPPGCPPSCPVLPPVLSPPRVIGGADFSVQLLADISGCVRLQGAPLVNRQVVLKQQGERRQTTTTDAGGCYTFQETVPGKPFQIIIKSPEGS